MKKSSKSLPVHFHRAGRTLGARIASAAADQTVVRPINVPARWGALGTCWPRVGGSGFRTPPRDAFLSPGFLERYRPGITRIIYVANCPGLRALAARIAMPLGKVSSCGADRLLERLREASDDGYAAGWINNGELVLETGWAAWDATLLRAVAGSSPNSPVTLTPRAIIVRLPEGMTADAFDVLWDAATRHAALDRWASTRYGASHFAKIGCDPAIAKRRTVYPYDTKSRISRATEICTYRLSQDADRLIAVAEALILEALGLLD